MRKPNINIHSHTKASIIPYFTPKKRKKSYHKNNLSKSIYKTLPYFLSRKPGVCACMFEKQYICSWATQVPEAITER